MINEELLINVTFAFLHKNGISFTMDDIANELHVSKRTLYFQIVSKQNLLILLMDYATKKLNELFDEVINNNEYSDLEKIQIILYSQPMEFLINDDKESILKRDFNDVYIEYSKRIEDRWNRIFNLIDQFTLRFPLFEFDKVTFKTLYLASAEIAYNLVMNGQEKDFQEVMKKNVIMLTSPLENIIRYITEDSRLSNLLSDLGFGVMILDYKKQFVPIYLSKGYYKHFDNVSIDKNKSVLNQIYEEDYRDVMASIKDFISGKGIFDETYRVKTANGLRWHHARALKVKYEGKKNIVLVITHDNAETKEIEERIHYNEERLQLAFSQTSLAIWECIVPTKTLIFSEGYKNKYYITSEKINNAPDELLKSNYVHPDFYSEIKKFFKRIYSGEKTGSCAIKILDIRGNYIWVKHSFKMIFDEKTRKPLRAVGITERIGNIIEVKTKFSREDQLAHMLSNILLAHVKINMTSNEIINITAKSDIFENRFNDCKTYDDYYSAFLNIFTYVEEYKRFESIFEYNKILDCFEQEKASAHIAFRATNANGKVVWISYTVNITNDPVTGDLYLFGYIRDIDTKMKLELSLDRKVEYDVTTRLYLNNTMKKMTDLAISKHNNPTSLCAFVILEIVNFAQIKRQYGLDIGEKVLFYIGRVLKICLNNRYIVGRTADNQFAVFFPSIDRLSSFKDSIKDIISMANASYRLTTNEEEFTNIKTSIYVTSILRTNFDTLYYETLKNLNKIKLNETEMIDNIDYILNGDDSIGNSNNKNAFGMYKGMDSGITKGLLETTTAILAMSNSEESIKLILANIQKYYQCVKSYIIELDYEKMTATCKYEYLSDLEYRSTLNESTCYSKMPLFLDAFNQKKNIFIHNIENIKAESIKEYEYLKSYDTSACYLVPISINGVISYYIGINNPLNYSDDVSFLTAMSYLTGNELNKILLEEKQRFIDEYDELTKLRNHASYRKRINSIKKTTLSTIGVACITINDIRKINREEGSKMGDSVYTVLGQILRKYFEDEETYRYDGEKFFIISLNIEYQSFNERLDNIVEATMRFRPGLINIGKIWKDDDIDIEKVIGSSEELMLIDKNNTMNNLATYNIRLSKIDNLNEAFKKKWFVVYLQPQYDIIENTLFGAEALIRLVHPDYNLIAPDRFIPLLEKDGLISYVDLFVLEEVCMFIRDWRKEGNKVIPISINYSRITLLEKDIIARTKAILKKYNIPIDLIEIEITESIGSFDRKTISEMANKFIKEGFRLAIDDFGSKYSSLSILSIIPFNTVKLDRSIVTDLSINKRGQVIVEYVAKMCEELKMKSVAEGIETEEQYNEIKARGCNIAQGYYIDKPMSINDFKQKYKNN